MSKSNSVGKVLRVAIKRIERGWTQGAWVKKPTKANPVPQVCLEGAIFGFCSFAKTPQQKEALGLVTQVILERETSPTSVALWNDHINRTQDEVIEILKLALIRKESGGLIEDGEAI